MRLVDVQDDDRLEDEEFEGLISSNENQNAMRNTLTRPPPPPPPTGCKCLCLQYTLVTIALLCAFFIGRDYDIMSFDLSSLRGKDNMTSVEGLDVSTKAPEEDKENVFEQEPNDIIGDEPSKEDPIDEVKDEIPDEPVESENSTPINAPTEGPTNVPTVPPTESPTQSPTEPPIDKPDATPEWPKPAESDTTQGTNAEIEEKWGKW